MAASGPSAPSDAPDLRPGDGVRRGVPMATRRAFTAAAAATALAAARDALAGEAAGSTSADAASGGSGAGSTSADAADAASSAADGDAVATDPNAGLDEGFTNMLGFEDQSSTWGFEPTATLELPVGSVVHADCDDRAAVLQANDSARPLTVVGCLDLVRGSYQVVLDTPVAGEDFAPSECHMTDRLICWTETNNATDEWRLYGAPFDGSPLSATSDVTLLAQGDAEWLPPQVAVEDDLVVWQLMPDPSGSHVTEASHAYRWRVGRDEGVDIWDSNGRFACAPAINEGVLTIAPRVDSSSGVSYGITSVDLQNNNAQLDQLVLPTSVKPFMVNTIDGAFAFSIEANYGYGGTLGSMGYYVGPSGGPYLALSREPSAQISFVNSMYVFRSQLSYFIVDPRGKRFTRLYAADNSSDYGDYPATSGTAAAFVTYALVRDEETRLPSSVLVRIYGLD